MPHIVYMCIILNLIFKKNTYRNLLLKIHNTNTYKHFTILYKIVPILVKII